MNNVSVCTFKTSPCVYRHQAHRGNWFSLIMSSTIFYLTAIMRNWNKKKTNATFGIDEKGLFLVVLLQILCGDGHNCDCFSEVSSEFHRCISAWFVQWNFAVFLTSLELLRRGAIGMVFLCQFIHLAALLQGPSNFELLITIFWISLEAIVNSINISSAHCGPRNAVSLPQFFRAEHHEVAPSWWRSSGLRKHQVAIGENCGWIRSLPRDVHKCNRVFLDSNKEGIFWALHFFFRITRITLHCPFREPSLSIRYWTNRWIVHFQRIFVLI